MNIYTYQRVVASLQSLLLHSETLPAASAKQFWNNPSSLSTLNSLTELNACLTCRGCHLMRANHDMELPQQGGSYISLLVQTSLYVPYYRRAAE
jgi:hypothetical protein